jgi:septum site-determining protein MinC
MKRTSPNKRQRPDKGSPGVAPRSAPEARAVDDLKAMTRTQLVALVMELQNRQTATAGQPEHSATEDPPEGAQVAKTRAKAALVIDSSVRSGQTIEFPEGDVTVIGSVGSGAEIIAGGSIHVYGTLRGRAIAGASGDQTARIFCQDLDAELLSIDGRYRVADNFDQKLRGRPVQARLEGMRMALIPLECAGNVGPDQGGDERIAAQKIWRATERMRQLIKIGGAREMHLGSALPAATS